MGEKDGALCVCVCVHVSVCVSVCLVMNADMSSCRRMRVVCQRL